MSAPDTTSEAGAVELRRQEWRVLKLDDGPAAAGGSWLELPTLSGEGQYGYRPTVRELGEAYGAGTFLVLERKPAGEYVCGREYEVRSKPTYYSATDADLYELTGEGEGELDG